MASEYLDARRIEELEAILERETALTNCATADVDESSARAAALVESRERPQA
jgi:hypothetical protein